MNVNFGTYDESALKRNYENALKDANFQKLVNRLNLPVEELMKHTSKLEKSVRELEHCKSCKSLAMCKNELEGFVYFPKIEEGIIHFDAVACKYKQKKFNEESLSCNYYEMPENLKKASMSEIDINDKKRIIAIKKLKGFYDTYINNPHQKGLYLTGSFGSGKTYLTCAMMNELAKKGVNIIVVYYPELLRSLKESLETDFASRINKLKKTDILFLDDIGAEAVTPWARDEILGTILQYRMDAVLPTFFTSNLNINELEEHLSTTKGSVDKVKARRIIERVKELSEEVTLISENKRNS